MLIDTSKPKLDSNSGISVQVTDLRFLRPQAHSDVITVLFCLSGSIDVYVLYEICTLQAGEFVVCDLDDVFYAKAAEENVTMILQIDAERMEQPYEELHSAIICCGKQYNAVNPTPYHENVYDYLLSFLHVYMDADGDKEDLYKALSKSLLDLLTAHFTIADYAFPKDELLHNQHRYLEIIQYLKQHGLGKLTIHDLAQHFYLNENYISQFIRRSTGGSFTRLLNFYRCLNGQWLLLTTNKTVQEISDECFFSSKKYFHKHFKEFWKTTPLQHKKHFQMLQQPDVLRAVDSRTVGVLCEKFIADRFIKMCLCWEWDTGNIVEKE